MRRHSLSVGMNNLAVNIDSSPVYSVSPERVSRSSSRCQSLALAVASMLLVSTTQAADDKTYADLQAENARLKVEIERLQHGNAAQGDATQASTAEQKGADVETQKQQDEGASLGKVVVRGRRSIEAVHDVPISVSVVSGEELTRELSQDLNAFTKRTGNIVFNQSNTRGASVSIRGLGRRSFTETQDPSVLVIADGVSYGLTQLANFDFYDVASVEVARGPQGTLGGKSASAGTVTINTRAPSFTPGGNYQVAYGQREALLADVGFGGPILNDLLAWRGALHIDKARGYYVNAYNERGNYSLYNKDRVSGRTQFLVTPSDHLSIRLSVDFQPRAAQLQNGLTQFVDPPDRYADGSLVDPSGTNAKAKFIGFTDKNNVYIGPRTWFVGRGLTYRDYVHSVEHSGSVNFNETQGQVVSVKGGSAQVDWNVGKHTLTSITAYRATSFDARNDEGTPFDISKSGGGGVFYRQYSQEFRVAATLNDFIDYQAGVFAFLTRDQVESKTGWGSDAGAWYATTQQYATLDTNAGTNRGAGLALLRDSLADAYRITDQNIKTQSTAIFANVNWHFTDALTLNTGLRVGKEHRSTEDVALWAKDGSGAALNPVATPRGYPLGGFASETSGALTTAANSAAQLSVADYVANRYFGSVITATPGEAYNALSGDQKAIVAAAKAIRSGQIGPLINGVKSYYSDTLRTAVLSPSYKFNRDVTGYLTWQYGEKSGSALNVNGVSANVKPEKTQAFELGAKMILLNKTLDLNVDAFLMDIRDYQQTVRAIDEFATQTNIANDVKPALVYTSVQGNVNKVRVKGVEFDSAYSGIPNTVVRLAGAYNDARYRDYRNAPKPLELTYLKDNFIDQSGKTLPGAPKWTFNVGAEYSQAVFNDKLFHFSFNTNYTSRYNNDETLTDYAWVPAHSVTDASLGLGTASKSFDVSVVIKNAFDDRSHEASDAGWSYEPYPYPRWWGVVISGRL